MASTLRMPLTIAPGGTLAALPQGGGADLAQSVALLLETLPGERRTVPAYGLPDPLGSGVSVEDIVQVVGEWEDRADPTHVEEIARDIVQEFRVFPPATTPAVPPIVEPEE